jgi:sec-independent protein translocase protein TatB
MMRFRSQVHLVDSPAMFNLSSSEIVFLLLLALIVLGPEKLPEAVRKFGKTYGEFKKMTTGFQSELRTALDEPMREMRETAEAFKKAANFDFEGDDEVTPAVEAAPEQPPTVVDQPAVAVDEPAVADAPEQPTVVATEPKRSNVVETEEETAPE